MIGENILFALGCDPSLATESEVITTASGVELVPVTTLASIVALGVQRTTFKVLSLEFPPGAGIDGLLGLDFLRDSVLTIDFRKATLMLDA